MYTLDYFLQQPELFAKDMAAIGKSDSASRQLFCEQVKYVGFKTYSFLDLMHKGTGFITLDVHVMRGLYYLGVDMSEWFFVKKPTPPTDATSSRGRLRAVTCRPTDSQYVILEAKALDIFSHDSRFLMSDGHVDGGLATTLLWWMGAGRRDSTFDMFGYHSSQELPYGPKVRVD